MDELVERFYTLLHYQLMAKLPQKDGFHIYATNNLISHVKTNIYEEGIEIVISEGVDYARYALGYDDLGSRMTPSPNSKLQAFNYKIVENCIEEVAKALSEAGGVSVNGNQV